MLFSLRSLSEKKNWTKITNKRHIWTLFIFYITRFTGQNLFYSHFGYFTRSLQFIKFLEFSTIFMSVILSNPDLFDCCEIPVSAVFGYFRLF